jgi:hypothetical protein
MSELNTEEAQRLWKSSAVQDFNRELGPRISSRKTQGFLSSFLNQQEGSQEALATIFQNFPDSAKNKAFALLDKYKTGFLPNTQILNSTPEAVAAQKNIFTMPNIDSDHLSESGNKFLTDWLGVKDIENKTMRFAFPGGPETFLGTTSYTNPARTGGQLVDAASESINQPGNFYNELNRIGATPEELTVLDKYLNKNAEWQALNEKTKQTASNLIDSTIQKATNSDSWSSFKEKDLPLFRGIAGSNLDPHTIGSTFTTESPTSWSPVYGVAKAFATGATKQNPNNQPLTQRMYAVTEYSNEARDKLLVPGIESEVLAPSQSKFEVTGIGKLRDDVFDQDIELVKLKQLYATDPISMGIKGAIDLAKNKPIALAGGIALNSLTPDVANFITQKKYSQAINTIAKNTTEGLVADAGIRLAGQGLAKIAPGFATSVNPIFAGAAETVIPAAVGAGLLMQGQTNSPLNKIVTAVSNTPFGLKVNPKTDIGRNVGHAISNTVTDWITRNQPNARSYVSVPETTPTIQPRMGNAVLNNKIVQVPYGSVAGTKTVGRPWWDQLGSKATDFANLLNRGSIIGR